MRIWRTQPLVSQLRAGPLPEADQFKYFAAFFLLAILGWCIPIDSDAKGWLGTYGSVCWLIYGAIAAVGLLWSFRVNQRLDNSNFVGRFIALSLPITVQLFVIMAICLALAVIILDRLGEESFRDAAVWDWFWFALQAALECAYFVRMSSLLRRINPARTSD